MHGVPRTVLQSARAREQIVARPRWLLPPLVTIAMTAGVLATLTAGSSQLLHDGPSGDTAGAGAALTLIVASATAFTVSTAVCFASWRAGRPAPLELTVRLAVCFTAGVVAGRLAGVNDGSVVLLAWALLSLAPVATSM